MDGPATTTHSRRRRQHHTATTCLLLLAHLTSAAAVSLGAGGQQDEAASQQQRHHHQPAGIQVLQVHKINSTPGNSTVTCNDGSQIGYYARLNGKSKNWIIYLQGGGFCAGHESCQQRWQRSPHLMSSNFWPKTRTLHGLLSNDPQQNPHLWSANHVFLPYCSSDFWSGSAPANAEPQVDGEGPTSFAFMGSKILERVLDSLYDDWPRDLSLHGARHILLAGDSAGAIGVLLNLDRASEIVARRVALDYEEYPKPSSPVVRGLADSGWFLDNEPFSANRVLHFGAVDGSTAGSSGSPTSNGSSDCDGYLCSPLQSIRRAMLYWNGQVPDACARHYHSQPWRCYFGYRAHQTLKTPLFVVQWLYDEAQLIADNISRPDSIGQWNYIRKLVSEMRSSLENVTALFAPSCFAHSLVIKPNWNQISIDGLKLAQLLQSWQEQWLPDVGIQVGLDENTTSGAYFADAPVPHTSVGHHRAPLAAQPEQSTNGISQMQPMPPPSPPLSTTSRPRNRKRKRNNHHQRNKQYRPKSSPSMENQKMDDATGAAKESNEVVSTMNPLQDLLPLIDRLVAPKEALASERQVRQTSNWVPTTTNNNNSRSGRSTLVDDSTIMLSNNVPEDSSSIQLPAIAASPIMEHRIDSRWSWTGPINRFGPDRFRLMDSCDWPQCNRDCPISDSDLFISGGLIQF